MQAKLKILKFNRNKRFYHVYLQNNFFRGITVVCSWGTFDSNRGGCKYIFCDNMQEVNLTLDDIKNIRLKRGYRIY